MAFGADQLRDKALLALEEAVQECRYRPVRRSFALRFALPYLWAYRPGNRAPFDEFWRTLVQDGMWRFGSADRALFGIYQALGLRRDNEVAMQLWKQLHEEEGGKGI